MNRASLPRKTLWPVLLAAGAVVLGGCGHFPYYGDEGVYYGKSYERHGYHRPYYGRSAYRYDYYRYGYDYYDYYGYRPYGYRYYGRSDHDHDRDREHRVREDGSGVAADELRRITRDGNRESVDRRGGGPTRIRRPKQDEPGGERSDSGHSARGQLRDHRARPSDSPASRSSPRSGRSRSSDRGSRPESRSDGGIRTPRDRR